MRLSLRFIIPLGLVLAAIAYAVIPLVDRLMLTWFVRDLDIRSVLVANTVQDPLLELLGERTRTSRTRIIALFSKITLDERLFAAGYCDATRQQLIATGTFPRELNCK